MLISHDTANDLLSKADVDHEPARGARLVMATGVEDVDAAACEELRGKGVEFIRAPEDRHWELRCAHFKDSYGNVLRSAPTGATSAQRVRQLWPQG